MGGLAGAGRWLCHGFPFLPWRSPRPGQSLLGPEEPPHPGSCNPGLPGWAAAHEGSESWEVNTYMCDAYTHAQTHLHIHTRRLFFRVPRLLNIANLQCHHPQPQLGCCQAMHRGPECSIFVLNSEACEDRDGDNCNDREPLGPFRGGLSLMFKIQTQVWRSQ